MLALVTVLLLSSIACGCSPSSKIVKPTVAHVPQEWYCSNEDPYGTYEETDGTKSGLIEYTDHEDSDFVQIYYGNIPSELSRHNHTQNNAL